MPQVHVYMRRQWRHANADSERGIPPLVPGHRAQPLWARRGQCGYLARRVAERWLQTFTNVAANKLYRITEGSSVISPVALGVAPVYQCGPPPLNAAVDQGVFLWRDCPTGEWRMKTAAGSGAASDERDDFHRLRITCQ